MRENFRRKDEPSLSIRLSPELLEIKERLDKVSWAHAQLKQLERLPSTFVVEGIRQSLMEVVSGFTCIDTAPSNEDEDDPLFVRASHKAITPDETVLSSEDYINRVINILNSVDGWKASMAQTLLRMILNDSKRGVS